MPAPGADSPFRQFPLIAYFALAYGITWALLLPLALSSAGLLPVWLPPEWHALGALGPLTAALLVTRAEGGLPAVRRWLESLVRRRVAARWWFIATLSPVVLFVAAAVLVRVSGGDWPDFGRLALAEYANRAWLLDLLFVGTFAYGIGEEPGWRGFVLPRLERRHGPLVATVILTPFWALWHLPAFFYRPSYQGGLPTIVGFVFGLLAGAIVLTFLYDAAHGSVLPVIFWHALINIAMQLAAVTSQPVVATMNVLLAIAAAGIAVWWTWRGRRISAGGAESVPVAASG